MIATWRARALLWDWVHGRPFMRSSSGWPSTLASFCRKTRNQDCSFGPNANRLLIPTIEASIRERSRVLFLLLEEKLPLVEKVMSDVNPWLQSKKHLKTRLATLILAWTC